MRYCNRLRYIPYNYILAELYNDTDIIIYENYSYNVTKTKEIHASSSITQRKLPALDAQLLTSMLLIFLLLTHVHIGTCFHELLACERTVPGRCRVQSHPLLVQRQRKQVAANKIARRNYEVCVESCARALSRVVGITARQPHAEHPQILEDFEAGIALVGTEVKSCRAGKCQLRDGYCRIKDGECWLHNVNIGRHATAGPYFQHDETRACAFP